jgi:hypothetical protein
MTENEKIAFQIKEMKGAIKKLKNSVGGINLHLDALEREVRKIAKKN